MPDFSIKIEGLEEVVEMLDKAPRTIVARGYLKALQAGANVIADAVEIRTPVKAEDTGGLLDKGELRESLMIDIQLDSALRGGVADIGFGKNGNVANWIEYGHRIVGHKPGKTDSGASVPANPFMRGAADGCAEAAIDAFTGSLKETIAAAYPQSNVA